MAQTSDQRMGDAASLLDLGIIVGTVAPCGVRNEVNRAGRLVNATQSGTG
jgi:hypothetical protein